MEEPEKIEEPMLPAAIDMETQTVSEAYGSLQRLFHYSASLPERTFRSASALAGGFVRESANWLIPTAFRNSKSYSIFVQQMLDFVVNDIGQVRKAISEAAAGLKSVTKEDSEHDRFFVARKTVGNLLDMTALATFHLSPLTVLAIFSDLAYGSRVYLQQLSERLKEQGIIDRKTTIDNTSDLLHAIEKASGKAADMFDQPPISLDGLRHTIAETQLAIAQINPSKILPAAEIDQMWRQMELAAREQNASIWDVSATVTIVAINQIHTVGQGAVVSLQVAGNLFQEQIVDHYWLGLRAVEREGLIPTLSKASQPYLETVWANFALDRRTWTEKILSGELLKWGWSQLSWPKLTRTLPVRSDL